MSHPLKAVLRDLADRRRIEHGRRAFIEHLFGQVVSESETWPDEGLVHLHHVIPKAAGGTDRRVNVALLCPNCHAKAHWLYRTHGIIPAGRGSLLAMLSKHGV